MMTAPKLTQEDIKQIQKLLEKGHNLKDRYDTIHIRQLLRRAGVIPRR